MAFYRKGENQTLLVIANYQNEPQTVALEKPYKQVVLSNYETLDGSNTEISLKGYQVAVLEL